MPESAVPSWGDHPLPDPVPEAWGDVVELIRSEVDRYGGGDRFKVGKWSWALTLLSLRPAGDWAFPSHPGEVVRPAVPFAAPPEFVPFVDLDGHRTGYVGYGRSTAGCLGWIIPAPELGRADHPVGLVDLDEPTRVHGLGPDTRAGLARYFSVLSVVDMPEWYGMDSSTGSYAAWMLKVNTAIETIWNALELESPEFPQPGARGWPPSWSDVRLRFEVPAGWRHETGLDQVGVLAPAGAFAAERPAVPRYGRPIVLDQVLADAERLLGAGAPASALLLVKDVVARSEEYRTRRRDEAQQRVFDELKPLWARAYTDLGRPQLVERLELITSRDHWRW